MTDFESFQIDKPSTAKDSLSIGYLARLAPEKGLHVLIDAFIKLKQQPGHEKTKLKIGGWLGGPNQDYADEQFTRLKEAGLEDQYEYLGSFDRDGKLSFLSSIDVLSVPTVFKEPKGLYVLEAVAAGVPIVQPAHGCFPELISAANCGQMFEPHDAADLAKVLDVVLHDPDRFKAAKSGQAFVHEHRNADSMSRSMSQVLKKFVT